VTLIFLSLRLYALNLKLRHEATSLLSFVFSPSFFSLLAYSPAIKHAQQSRENKIEG